MADTMNIGRRGDAPDEHHRWEMEKLQIRHIGRGKNKRTVLENVDNVATALRCYPGDIIKFFALAFNTGKPKGTELKGVIPLPDLQEKLQDFIEMVCLCPECSVPRLRRKIADGKNFIIFKCGACGVTGRFRSKSAIFPKLHKDMLKRLRLKPPPKKRKPKAIPVEEIFTDDDFRFWEKDADLSRTKLERENDPGFNFNTEIPENRTPLEMLREVLHDPDMDLLQEASEFERILCAHVIDDLKAAKLVAKATIDHTDFSTVQISIEKNANFLKWFAERKDNANMLISLLEEACFNHDLLQDVSGYLEAYYDAGILTREQILGWKEGSNQNSYLMDAEDVELVKQHASVFLEWLSRATSQRRRNK